VLIGLAVAAVARFQASSPNSTAAATPVLERFLSSNNQRPAEYRALRHLVATNEHFRTSAWMEVWTQADAARGFRYEIVAEGGSDYIRSHVFVPALEAEAAMWAAGELRRTSLTLENYQFEPRGIQPDGLASFAVKPRRKDPMLVEGYIFLRPEDGELVRMEGRPTKAPSFWTRKVDIVRRFELVGGVRMPVELESTANVLIAGPSTFQMSYEYASVNGEHIGDPLPRTNDGSVRPR
jgi:hypothetical protein